MAHAAPRVPTAAAKKESRYDPRLADAYVFNVSFLRSPAAGRPGVEVWSNRQADCGYHANCG